MKKIPILILTCSLVVGCASKEIKPERSDIDQLLDQQIRSTHSNVQDIYGSSTYENAKVTSEHFTNIGPAIIPKPLKALIDVKWYGEASIVLSDLANSIDGMQFNEVGIKPAHPYDVFLNETKTKVYDLLKNIGHQLPDDAILDVQIDPFDKDSVQVQLQYEKD